MKSQKLKKKYLENIADIDDKISQLIKITAKDIHYDGEIPGSEKQNELKKRLSQDRKFIYLVKNFRKYLELYNKTDNIIYEIVGET
jgi:hypothetical protein